MTGFMAVFRGELRRIFGLAPVFSVLIVAAAVYAVFYPQPYLNEALRDVPIAVVDQDRSQASREIVRAVDASQDVAVAVRFADMPSAERAVFARQVSGILFIPQHFERDLLHGRPSPVAVYGDASYFLVYQRVAGAISAVAATVGATVEAGRLVATGVDPALAAAAVDPMPLTAVPLFNPEGGYATYILPAAFVLILQQLLLIGVGLLETLPRNGGDSAASAGPVSTVFGKLAAYMTVELVILPFYLVILPYLYGVPRLGGLAGILILAVPFVLAVGSLGIVLAEVFRTPLGVQLATASLGLPFFFLAGFSWPAEAIPHAIRIIALLVPSTTAIDGFVGASQMGAPIPELSGALTHLCLLAGVYVVVAILLETRRAKRRFQTISG